MDDLRGFSTLVFSLYSQLFIIIVNYFIISSTVYFNYSQYLLGGQLFKLNRDRQSTATSSKTSWNTLFNCHN